MEPMNPKEDPTPLTDSAMKECGQLEDIATMYGYMAEHAKYLEREMHKANYRAHLWYVAASPYATPEALAEAIAAETFKMNPLTAAAITDIKTRRG
jgi:hypothetical protein